MARPILMPQVGQDLTEGKIVAINVKLGDIVKKGDIVAEVESEKATFEVEAFEAGVVVDLPYKVGDTAIVLEPLMMVGDAGEVPEVKQAVADAVKKPSALASAPPPVKANGKAGSSPLARRLASEAGIDVDGLSGSGPGGAVVQKDLKKAQAKPDLAIAATGMVTDAIRNLQKGTGDPVLFIHGFGGDISAWRPFVLQLGLSNPIWALDLPAHGANAATSADHFDALVKATADFVKQSGLQGLHLVGHSLGAAVAAGLTQSEALDVRSLALLSPAGLGPKINGDYLAGYLASNSEAALKVWLEQLFYNPKMLPGALVRATLAARTGSALLANQQKLSAGLFAGNTQLFSIRDMLEKFSGPVRVIVGNDDRIIPASYVDAMPAHVAVNRLPQVGHLPQVEAMALTARLVAETVRSAASR